MALDVSAGRVRSERVRPTARDALRAIGAAVSRIFGGGTNPGAPDLREIIEVTPSGISYRYRDAAIDAPREALREVRVTTAIDGDSYVRYYVGLILTGHSLPEWVQLDDAADAQSMLVSGRRIAEALGLPLLDCSRGLLFPSRRVL